MKKIFLVALVAVFTTSCNSSADNRTSGDSISTMSSDTVSSGNSNMQSSGSSANSSMQGTGSADTGSHGSTADSSKMGAKDTSGSRPNPNR